VYFILVLMAMTVLGKLEELTEFAGLAEFCVIGGFQN
jgi:hypothetical protein